MIWFKNGLWTKPFCKWLCHFGKWPFCGPYKVQKPSGDHICNYNHLLHAYMHDLDPIVLCVWDCLIDYWFGMLVDIVFAWLIVVKLEKCETSKIKEVNQHSLPKERQVTLSSKVLLFSLYLVDFETCMKRISILMLC